MSRLTKATIAILAVTIAVFIAAWVVTGWWHVYATGIAFLIGAGFHSWKADKLSREYRVMMDELDECTVRRMKMLAEAEAYKKRWEERWKLLGGG